MVGNEDAIKSIAQKIFCPEERLDKMIRKRMEDDVESMDDIVDEFHSSINGYVDTIASDVSDVLDKIKKEEGAEFSGLTQEENKAYNSLVKKLCFEFAKQREEIMYGTKE